MIFDNIINNASLCFLLVSQSFDTMKTVSIFRLFEIGHDDLNFIQYKCSVHQLVIHLSKPTPSPVRPEERPACEPYFSWDEKILFYPNEQQMNPSV